MKTFQTRPLRRAKPAVAVEPLESRIAPASTVTLLASGDITVFDGMNANDTIVISLAGANLHFFDTNGIIAGNNAVQVDANNVEVPANALLGTLIVDTGSQPVDRVTFAPGLPLLNGVQVHTQTLTPLPTLAIGPNGLDLTASLSPISINGTIDAGGHSVVLHSGNAITVSAAAAVLADSIDATAVNGISLRMDANSINATNATNGGITLTELNTVAITSLNPGPGGLTLNSGTFILGTNNALAGSPNISVGGTLDLNGFNATIGALGGAAAGNVTNSTPATATLFVGANSASAVYPGAIGGNLEVVKTGSGDQTFSGPQSYLQLITNSGTLNLVTPLPNATIDNNGGVLNLGANNMGSTINVNAVTHFGGGQLLAALNIGAGGSATLDPHAPGGNPFVLDTQALTFVSGGKLDLTNNAMIVRGGDVAAITAQIASGYAVTTGGYWDGPGINSSAAAGDPSQITALGVLDNNNFGYTNLVGVPLTSNGHDVLVRFTYYGDADLNGVVDGVDYGLADNGLNNPALTGWLNGDFDYDGAVNSSDFSLLDLAYSLQAGGATGLITRWTGGAGTNDWFTAANWTAGVPGPADTAVLDNPNGIQPQLTAAASVAFFDHIAGSFSGAGVLTVSQGMTWIGGTEIGGATLIAGTASLTLAGAGGKLLDGRTLTIAGSTAGSTAATLMLDNGGTIQAGAALAPTLHLTLFPGGGVIDTNGFNIILDVKSSIDGIGALTKTGAGTLVLGSVNSYNGTTAINSGTLMVSATNQLSPSSAIFVNGGTLDLGAFDQSVAGVVLTTGNISATTGKLSSPSPIQLNGGVVTADLFSGTLIDINSATVNANLDAGPAGSITLDAGTWTVRSSNATSSALVINGGLLNLGAFTETVGNLSVTGGTIASTTGAIHATGSIDISNAVVGANLIGDSGIAVQSGTVNGNLDAGANTITLNGGTVTPKSGTSVASALILNGATFDISSFTETFGPVTVNAGNITSTTGSIHNVGPININGGTVDADLVSDTALAVNGGTVTPHSNIVNHASLLVVNGGIFALGAHNATFADVAITAGSITGTGTLTSDLDYALAGGTIAPKLAGNVGLTKNGPGTVVLLNSKNTFTGLVTINAGVLQIASNGALGNLANALDIEGGGTLATTASITSARHIIVNGAAPTINVTTGTVTLNGLIDGTGALQKTGPGTLVLGNNFVGTTVIGASLATTSVAGTKIKFTGPGTLTLTVVSDGMGGTRVSTVELADTDATTILAINGPKTPATTTIDTIKSLDPNDEIGTIKLGKTVIIGSGVNDAIADIDIHGKVNKLLFNDVNTYTLFELGKGLPYDNIADDTTPDSYNNHPSIKLRNVLGTGVIIDVTGDGVTPGDEGGIGGGGLGKVIVNQWDQPGLVKTTQSIGSFKFKHGDCNVVFEVDKDSLGTLTTAGIGKMLVPNGAWGSSGSIVEGNVTVFSAGQFLAAANITAGSMSTLLVKSGPYLGTTTLKNPNAPALGTFSVNGNYEGYIDSAQAMINLNIKGTFKGSLKAKSIGSITAYSFNGTVLTNDDPVGDPARHNIYVTDGSLGTVKTSAGGIKDFEIAVATVFNGFNIQWPTAPNGAVGINNVTVGAGQIKNSVVNLDLGVPNALNYGIKDSVFESAGSFGNLTSSHAVADSIFAAATNFGKVLVKGDLTGSKLLAGTSLGGDGVFDGDEVYTRTAKIGNITVLGTFGTTSIAVGVDPGAGFIYGDGNDVAAAGTPIVPSIGALVFGAASGGIFGPAGIIHTDAIEAATIKSLKVGASPVLTLFASSHYIRAGGSEVASDVLVKIV